MSGANKKQAAATKARLEREAAEKAAAERGKRVKLLGGAAGIVVVIIAIVLAAGAFKGNDAAEGSSEQNGVRGIAETKALLAGLPQDGTLLGKPDAPVTIHEFADLKCPACQAFEIDQQKQNVDELVRTGKANLRLHLINIIDPNVGTSDGAKGRIAANNLVAQNKYWSFVSTNYYNQGLESDSWITDDKLKELAAEAPGVGAAAINTRETPASRKLAADADKLASDLGATGTPAFFVQPRGTRQYTAVQSSVDSIKAGVEAATKKAQPAR
ncbi:thioredoxin domain-containing protein [Patulibacter sp.]|uniref:DsbA family protein n=1 Tax=Patulibacter sp. TaxID=1912859 RepID=UPI00271825A0|nr:thioredoxin domain-containing protein [Patulibacter sp.]MDO9406914.1 thioredoxin domain-containing protein [Patulibacter sp.]